MWVKVLGTVCAAIFVGAAVTEYTQILRKKAEAKAEAKAKAKSQAATAGNETDGSISNT